jgi:hypothetical protein
MLVFFNDLSSEVRKAESGELGVSESTYFTEDKDCDLRILRHLFPRVGKFEHKVFKHGF